MSGLLAAGTASHSTLAPSVCKDDHPAVFPASNLILLKSIILYQDTLNLQSPDDSSVEFLKWNNTTFWLNFVIMMNNLIKECNSGWKMTPLAAKLVSNEPCFYNDVFFVEKCSLCPDWLVYAAPLSDRWHRYELICCLCALTGLCRQQSPQATHCQLAQAQAEREQFAATFPTTVLSQFKLNLKERVTTNVIKSELAQMAAGTLSLKEFYATANISLLAC